MVHGSNLNLNRCILTLCIPKDCNLFNFGDRVRLVLIAPLRYFDFVNADTPFNGYMQLPR